MNYFEKQSKEKKEKVVDRNVKFVLRNTLIEATWWET